MAAHVSWLTAPSENVTLNLALDVALAAGFSF